jgi:hypothetical protein
LPHVYWPTCTAICTARRAVPQASMHKDSPHLPLKQQEQQVLRARESAAQRATSTTASTAAQVHLVLLLLDAIGGRVDQAAEGKGVGGPRYMLGLRRR